MIVLHLRHLTACISTCIAFTACQNPFFAALGLAEEQKNNTAFLATAALLLLNSPSATTSDCTGGMNIASTLQTGGNVSVSAATYHGQINGTDLYKAVFPIIGISGKTVTLTSATTSGSNIFGWDGSSTCGTGQFASNDNQGSGDSGVTSFNFSADGNVWVVAYKTNSAGTISASMN